MVRVLLGFWGWSPENDLMRQAEDDALRTLRLDDNQSDAHVALGNVHWWHHWNFAAAEREIERAVAVSPNDPMRRWAWFGFLGTVKEDHERAMAEAEAALELDPLSVLMRVETSWVLYWSRQFDRAIAGCREALTVEPDYPTAYWIIGLAQVGKSEFHPARDTFKSSFDRFGDSYSLAGFGAACGLSGQRPEACRVLEELHRRSATEWVSEVYFAWVHIGLREPQKALDWLERAIDQRNPHVLWIRVSQLYDPLRGEPRFSELVARLNLPEPFKTARPGQG